MISGLLAGSTLQRQTDTFVDLNVVPCVPTAPGHSQKKEISPGAVVCHSQRNYKIKSVKLASCVTLLSCVKPVVNARDVASNPPVGARLQSFWQIWSKLGASYKVAQILRSGYTLPFQNRPLLSRHPTVISRYVNHHRNSYLSEALHQLISKNAVEPVRNPNSLGFFNRLFLVPKPNNKWRPILDLSNLNPFLKVEKFKMETPETIRTSLQRGEWVTSVDFRDAYFHIPIQEHSRKYLRFHVQGQTYQFKALPFGLSTAPLEFTVIAKEVKLMAMHETHSVAPQKQLEGTGIFGKDHPYTQVPAPSSAMVVRRKQCATRPTITPSRACSTDLYRRIKRRVGRSLKRAHCKGPLVGSGKQTAHKLSRVESSLSSSQRVPRTMYRQDSSSGIRQHYSSGLYKQRRRYEVGPSMCPTVEDPDLVLPETSDVKSPSHPGPSERDSRQAIQTRSDHTDRVVPPPGGISKHMQEVAPTSSRSVCHKIQPQTSSVCLSSPGPSGCSSGCSHSAMGGPGCICLSTDLHLGQSSGEATGLPVPESYSDCSRVAQHALVLGLGGHVQSNSPQPTKPAQSLDTAVQPDPSQESDKPESPCMAPRATAIKEQGFSKAVAARIEAPQRKSTRSVYEAKWTIFTKWCITNQVDFGSPPIKSVADFLLYLFEVKKLQPSTIDGYRSAIADKLGNTTGNISKDDNLTRLLDSFHRDRPRGRRGIPSWNLSLVLHQLTKAPFEPLKEASMKHLTFKTVFLLALGSGKRRSEIHAWQHKNIRHQSDWSKVSLFPSPSFLSKNQLAKEGPESVAPVVIPALAPTLDRSLKSDRTLCPVRALRYYLDRTSDLRQGKELVFVSFKKGFDKDISPATISSWIKQTVILCYELSDHQAHTLHQVKAHDVRAFAASKAFQSGVSLEQILSACHWKSHNTFTQFYLKDVAWADSELYHLGPVVAAQQIHQQAST